MRREDCFQLGQISRLHGYEGKVIAVFETDRPQHYYNMESVFVDYRGELVPFFIEELATNSKGHFILQFEDVTPEEAQKLVDCELYLPLEILPPLEGKQFYYHEVMGFRMIDKQQGEFGVCDDVIDSGPQPLFKVLKGEIEILIPAVDEIILSIDRDKQEIHLDCPEGLIDLYK